MIQHRSFISLLMDRYARANIRLLAEREIRGKTAGTYVGLGHYFLVPLLMLLIYSFVFGTVFSARWPQSSGGFMDFATRMFLGLIAFQYMADVVNRAPGLVLENPSYVTKVQFPLETLVPIVSAAALFNAAISFGIFIAAYVLSIGIPPLTALWVPVLSIPLMLFSAGIGWLLSALGVFLRDLRNMIGIFVSLLMFLSPVFYPLSAVPSPFNALLFLNPMTPVIEGMRNAMFLGLSPSVTTLVALYAASFAIAQFGYWVFMGTKKGFADVL